ncbi:MAG: biopolymer transporter ExbD [Proteobacteria bacterium]|nr:biopolymer transporter ExbD [Pseudomonadota bacterium]
MVVHHRRRERLTVQAPLTSLIDIVFLLLIYFLLTTNFMVDEGIKIKLPQARAAAPQVEETITVYVDEQGRAHLADRECEPAVLFDLLKDMLKGRQDKLVVIKADRSVILNYAVKVMDVAKAAGAERLLLATEKDM